MAEDCKACAYADTLYQRKREDRYSNVYAPTGYVRCHGPRYKGRAYFCRDSKPGCSEYVHEGRGT